MQRLLCVVLPLCTLLTSDQMLLRHETRWLVLVRL